MTECVPADAAYRRAQGELGSLSRIIDVAEISASIAHEVQQPLAAAISSAEAARNWLSRSQPLVSEAVDSIQAVIAEAHRAAEITTRMCSLFAGAIPQQAAVDINDVVCDVIKRTGADLAKRNIVPECCLAPALGAITGDATQLQQMLLNLMNNAANAMADVSNRKRELLIQTRARGEDAICITVSDSGHGFRDADTSRIFQPFYSTRQGGMGVGLWICQMIVESHRGSIHAMARRPYGAILQVELPVRRDDRS